MGLKMHFLAFWFVFRILIQRYVLEASTVSMVDDIFRVVFDEKFLDLADVLQMGCIELYFLLVIERALSTELVYAGVAAQTVLIVGLRGKSIFVGVVFLARTSVLICFFKEINIKRSIFFFN